MPVILTSYQIPIFNASGTSTNETCHLFLNRQDEEKIWCHDQPCIFFFFDLLCAVITRHKQHLNFKNFSYMRKFHREPKCNLKPPNKWVQDTASNSICKSHYNKKPQEQSFDKVCFMRPSYCTSTKHKIRYHFWDSMLVLCRNSDHSFIPCLQPQI